jgi:hypothetical protein
MVPETAQLHSRNWLRDGNGMVKKKNMETTIVEWSTNHVTGSQQISLKVRARGLCGGSCAKKRVESGLNQAAGSKYVG